MTSLRNEGQGASMQADQDQSLFLHDDDSDQCENFCKRIVKDGLNLTIVGANAVIADHYCSMIVKRLRRYPDIRLEVHSPTNTEALLNSFNKVLESLSTAEATAGRTLSAPLRILIASDADDINPAHGRLLARLVGSFPGANTQLIVLQTGSGSDNPMGILGNRLLHWRVPMPSRTEASKMLEIARSNGLELEATKLLNKVNPLLLLEDSRESSPLPEINVIEATHPQAGAAGEPDDGAEEEKHPTARRKSLSASLLWGFMVIVAAVVVVPLFPQQMGAIRNALFGLGADESQLSSSKRDSEATQAISDKLLNAAPPPEDTDAAKQMVDAGTDPADSNTTMEKGDNRLTPAPPALPLLADAKGAASSEPPVPPPVNSASGVEKLPSIVMNEATGTLRLNRNVETPAQPGKPAVRVVGQATPEKPAAIRTDAATLKSAQLKADSPPPPPPSPSPSPLPKKPQAGNEMDDAVRKIRAAPRQSIFVQHVALDSYSDARNWKSANSSLSASLIVPVLARQLGAVKYSVVSGPFPTRKQALDFAQSKGVPPEHWLRSSESLVNALAPTN